MAWLTLSSQMPRVRHCHSRWAWRGHRTARDGFPSPEPTHIKAPERWANQPGLHLPSTPRTPLSLGSSASGVHLGAWAQGCPAWSGSPGRLCWGRREQGDPPSPPHTHTPPQCSAGMGDGPGARQAPRCLLTLRKSELPHGCAQPQAMAGSPLPPHLGPKPNQITGHRRVPCAIPPPRLLQGGGRGWKEGGAGLGGTRHPQVMTHVAKVSPGTAHCSIRPPAPLLAAVISMRLAVSLRKEVRLSSLVPDLTLGFRGEQVRWDGACFWAGD